MKSRDSEKRKRRRNTGGRLFDRLSGEFAVRCERVKAAGMALEEEDIGCAANPERVVCSSVDSVTGEGNPRSSSSPRSSIFDVDVPAPGVGGIDRVR